VGVTVRVDVGQRVIVAEGVMGVAVGPRVHVGLGTKGVKVGGGVGVIVGDGLGPGVKLGVGVIVGVRVRVGVNVRVGVRVGVGVRVRVDPSVAVGEGLGVRVGGSPSTRKIPTTFHSSPTKICTWYSPGSHSEASGFQSVKPKPPVPPSQGLVSNRTSSPLRYHKAVHWTPLTIPS
jgi:hypothetical protein